MTAGTLVFAIVCGSVFAGSGLVVALSLKRAFFADWSGSEAVVATVLLWICWALALGQLLGAVGLLRRGALLVTALVTAAIARAWAAHHGGGTSEPAAAAVAVAPAEGESADGEAAKRWSRAAEVALLGTTALLVLIVAAVWVARTVITIHRGINDPDSLGYHLAFATTFAQTGYANQHRFVLPYLPVHFYPANDELLVAIALALTHSVAFAAVKNLLYGGFVLVAAHAIGKTYRAGLAAVACAAIVLGLPVIAFSQPGEAVNDALMILVIVGGLALLARAGDRPAPYVLAGACAGVAVGIKFSALFPAAGLGVFALVLLMVRVPTQRPRWAGATMLAAVALGGSWYLRNELTYRNPVPPTKIHLGPIRLPQIATASGPKSLTVLSYLKHGQLLAQFRHGLALGLGPYAAVVLGAWAVGAVICLVVGDGLRRGIGLFTLVCAFGYIATPASAFGMAGPTHPLGAFVINIHYAAIALFLGLIAFALVMGRTRLAWLLPAFGVVVVATAIRPGQRIAFWSPQMGAAGFDCLVAAAIVGAVAVLMTRWPAARSGARAVMALAALVAVVGAVIAARRYPSQEATDPVERWAAQVHDATVAAWVPDIALLYGPGSTNRVLTLTELSQHAPVPLGSCRDWMEIVIVGHFGYSAAIPGTMWNHWLASDPAFKLVAADELAAVYQVVGQPNINCPGQG